MPLQLLGPIHVVTPGAPVPLAPVFKVIGFATCHAALFQALHTNTGKVYIGAPTMDKTTQAGCAAVLAIPTNNAIPSFGLANPLSPAGIDVASLALDADQPGDGVLLTILYT